jgi:hypothetical protein
MQIEYFMESNSSQVKPCEFFESRFNFMCLLKNESHKRVIAAFARVKLYEFNLSRSLFGYCTVYYPDKAF